MKMSWKWNGFLVGRHQRAAVRLTGGGSCEKHSSSVGGIACKLNGRYFNRRNAWELPLAGYCSFKKEKTAAQFWQEELQLMEALLAQVKAKCSGIDAAIGQ
jgi:hypothetical protein